MLDIRMKTRCISVCICASAGSYFRYAHRKGTTRLLDCRPPYVDLILSHARRGPQAWHIIRPIDRQASWHQCPTECQRVEQLVSTDCGKRMKSKKISTREPCAARTNWLSATRDTPRPGPTYGPRQDSFLHSTPTRSSTRSRTCCPTRSRTRSPTPLSGFFSQSRDATKTNPT